MKKKEQEVKKKEKMINDEEKTKMHEFKEDRNNEWEN